MVTFPAIPFALSWRPHLHTFAYIRGGIPATLRWHCGGQSHLAPKFKEPEGVVAHWITRLQPFDFKIVHRPGKHHSHADGLARRASRPCKRDTCPEGAPLLHQVTPEEDRVRMVTPSDPYFEHFDGYLELVDDDSSLFRDTSALGPTPEQEPVSPELLWYLVFPKRRMIPNWQQWDCQTRPVNLVLVVVLWKYSGCWTLTVIRPQLRRSLSILQA